ncbi:MAG TPA: hypothetical protein DER64_03925 [Planctomycetaceae bacterium]|nr:hypothetical protein [Planctomycetaceae bacterium]
MKHHALQIVIAGCLCAAPKLPAEGPADGETVRTSGGQTEDWTNRKYQPANLWAYRPIRQPVPPDDSQHPVDAFLRAKRPHGLAPAPAAERLTLIRRLTFDLTGLPPTPQAIDRFHNDKRPDAYRRLINRLLESSRYGEQWGRHWLDVVRYADTGGFANDFLRPNAWRYRDYVIRSFNSDKPYDRFVREQIAGDELTPRTSENLVAVGFLRMGPWEHTGMSVARVTRQFFLDDVTNSVGQVFLGHVLRCARCHDHKFDPVPTRDYYSIQAVFAETRFAEVDAAFLAEENTGGFESHRKYHRQRTEANNRMLASLPGRRVTPDDFGRHRLGRKWKLLFNWSADRYRPIAFSVYNGPGNVGRRVASRLRKPSRQARGKRQPNRTSVLDGGDVFSAGDPVRPDVLSATGLAATIPVSFDGRRTSLADWITHPDNPLTARVIVNRIWQGHFGRGLATNPNNFGATGQPPTHPLLLDWLATEFVRRGWSIKSLHRLILTSAAYRRSSHHPDRDTLSRLDPNRAGYAVFRPRRLAAEELRDAMLVVSGELNPRTGGLPTRPDMNLEAALQPRMIMGTFAPSYVPDPLPVQRNRRTIYALKLRGHRDPFLTTFNQPGPDASCERRETSNVTPQVFALFNGQESSDRALALAARVLKTADSDADAIHLAFRLAFGREAVAAEHRAALVHWKTATADQADPPAKQQEWPTRITRRANEENTGEPFTFTETLFEYRDYVPDLQPHQVDARTRGLAQLCLVLFNANEFLYVY